MTEIRRSFSTEGTQAELAQVVGVTPRAIRKIDQEHGIFPKTGAGRYDIPKCVQAYIAYKIESETRRTAKGDYDAQRARREEVRIEIDKLRLRRMRGELHEAGAVEEVWNGMLVTFRAKLLALPSKWTPLLLGMTDPVAVMKYLEAQMHETLEELSEYDPQAYKLNEFDGEEEYDEEDGEDAYDEREGPGEKRKTAAKGAARKPQAKAGADRKRVGGATPNPG